ncbi:hypothetical protein [Sphingobium sp. YBL2]|uniref:hypothetical protein n=1 Tax=Sphingobium sp. (strain YBL2) TaxID=484429 RepID=UPI00069730E5|nr:hypothetical protein [Sphingobium sp. YBL2]
MLIFRKAVDRLADLLRRDRNVTYRAFINARIAPYVTPLLDRIVADNEDGDTLRNSLIPWGRGERPSIAIYRGDISTCRIDGPWQIADDHWLPLGGLIVTTGVTAHLDPFEAQELHKRMQRAIEDVTVAWVHEYELRSHPRGPETIDRSVSDLVAKAMIAAWIFGKREADTKPDPSPDMARDSCFDDPGDRLCALCRKGLGHA